MARASTRYVVDQRAISNMTLIPVKGIVAGYVQKFSREVKAEAVALAHATTGKKPRGLPRSGMMARSWTVVAVKYAARSTTFRVANSRPYAAFVFRGTASGGKGKIIVTGSKRMLVGKTQLNGLRHGRMPGGRFVAGRSTGKMPLRKKVRGQRANNIPMNAVAKVMARRGL